jgi:hypothetical protein
MDTRYKAPEVLDYGDLVDLTAWKGEGKCEDGNAKDSPFCSSPGN